MRILINAFSARQGGGQTYLINLLQFIPDGFPHEIFLLAPAALRLPVSHPGVTRIAVGTPVENPLFRALWERVRLPALIRDLRADLLFCPGGVIGAAPPEGCKTATMFRNLIPFDLAQRRRYPLGYQRVRNWLLQRVMLASMKQADLIIFLSDFARRVIERAAGGPLERWVLIPHGVGPRFKTAGRADIPRPQWLPAEGYLLYVSSLDYYKAQIEIVQGYALLKERGDLREKLLLVGPENPDYGRRVRTEVARLGLQSEVLIPGARPYEELPALYHHAFMNIFASEAENCPNILLEALGSGRPILCSNRPPMPDFGGDAVAYFDPASPQEFADSVLALRGDAPRMAALAALAAQRVALYGWENAARMTWDALGKLKGPDVR